MAKAVYNVLFLCSGNSARSIMAEALLDYWGEGRFKGYSAGSHPAGRVHPLAIALLQLNRLPTGHLRSKSWLEFTGHNAPEMDFVFTVCDRAAGEACPTFCGKPIAAHWGVPDPAEAEGSLEERRAVFVKAYGMLERRIRAFIDTKLELDRREVERLVKNIGLMADPAARAAR